MAFTRSVTAGEPILAIENIDTVTLPLDFVMITCLCYQLKAIVIKRVF